jgi:two-component system response regulator VanR
VQESITNEIATEKLQFILKLFCYKTGTEVIMADKILVLDDEREIADLVEVYLRNENFEVHKFYDANKALAYIENNPLDLAVLDLMLPGIVSGLSICQKIREKYTYPVIMLTAKDSETDKITGLTLGADDYITKPFLPLELVARVKAQLRRYKKYGGGNTRNDNNGVIVHSGLVIDVNTHEVLLNEKPLALTPTEFSILRILCEHPGSVVSAEKLFHEIWGDEYFTKSNNTITVHIRHLREKMGDTMDNPKYIKTVWGVGYKVEK